MMQLIHPITINAMKKDQQILQIEGPFISKCLAVFEQLDKCPPYNVHVVFVSSVFAEKETAIDFMSRLGNLKPLSDY